MGGTPTTITLTDGDVLDIGPLAGEPASLTTIVIAPHANVTINGNGSLIHNLRMIAGDTFASTAPHVVNINNLKISATSAGVGFTVGDPNTVVLNLTGANEIDGSIGIEAVDNLSITSSSGGTLTANGLGPSTGGAPGAGITATTLNIQGNAKVTAASSVIEGFSIRMGTPTVTINVAAGATLDATGLGGISGGNNLNVTLNIVCDGTITASAAVNGYHGIDESTLAVNITGSGTLNAVGAGNPSIYVKSLSVTGTTVNAVGSGFGLEVSAASDVTLAGGATLNLTGSGHLAFLAPAGTGFIMAAGTTVTLTNGSAASEAHPFTMAAGVPAGTVWQLTNTTPVGASTVTPLTVTVAAGQKGTIKLNLGAAPVASGATAVPTLNPAALALLAALLGWTALTLRRRRQ